MDTDSLVASFDTDDENLVEFLKQKKDEFDYSELDPNHEIYDTTNEKGIGKMKIETSPVLVLDNLTPLRSNSYSFSYGIINKAKQKRI